MPPLNQTDHGDQSWWTISQGWPETTAHAKAKYVFLCQTGLLPYGSYVFGQQGYRELKVDTLRIEHKTHLEKLDKVFDSVRLAILESAREELDRLSAHRHSTTK
jgi:hypothetical protein